jgi:IS1 family transposase
MIPYLVYSQLAIVGLLWLCIVLYYLWPSRDGVLPLRRTQPMPLRFKRTRANAPQPFAGLTQRPHCAACAHDAHHPQVPPPPRPEPMPPTHRRPCAIDTSRHFCPQAGCDYRGWRRLGNLRANGHPSGGPWRQLYCRSCKGYFLETHGTLLHGKRLSVELIVRVLACLAEGLGIRATARVFEVDPNTVLQWLVEAAEQLQAFTRYFLCDVHVTQLQLDELYAVIRDLKTGKMSEDGAIERLEGTRPWVWTAMEPVSKLLLTIEVGSQTMEMAQYVVHQVAQRFAPRCVPVWLSDGFKGYLPAILGHFGCWSQPQRRHHRGPVLKPRWMPLPGLRYAQVLKQYRCQRMVGVKHRVVFGTLEALNQVLAACGWKINTSFIERLNRDIRQRVAAVGRRVNTLCQGEDGLRYQLAVYHVYYNFVLPHASLRQPLLVSEPTNGTGSTSADSHHSDGFGEVAKHYPQAPGTRPADAVGRRFHAYVRFARSG